jgi:acyl dehydratase
MPSAVATSVEARAEWFEDYTLGDTVISPTMIITGDDVRSYSRFTNDVRPIFNRVSAGDAVLVPRLYLFSLGVALLLHGAGTYIPRNFVAFFGFDVIDFHDDARVGESISSTAVVSALTPRGDNGLITYDHQTALADGRLLVSSTHRLLVKQRKTDG